MGAGAFDSSFPATYIDHSLSFPERPEVDAVEYGEYLARLCQGCHGQGLVGGQPADPASPFAPDLTPSGRMPTYSEADFIKRAIRAVANGQAIFSPDIAERVMAYFTQTPGHQAETAFPELTPREHEVLALLAQGLTNSAIAHRLVLSPKTVRNHVSNIFSKLQVADRAEAIIRAREAGLGDQS